MGTGQASGCSVLRALSCPRVELYPLVPVTGQARLGTGRLG